MCKTKCCSPVCMVCKVLLLIGGLNWGLIGLGGFLSYDLNVVHMIFGGIMWLENLIYLLVGVAAVFVLIRLIKKLTCKEGECCSTPMSTDEHMEGEHMGESEM